MGNCCGQLKTTEWGGDDSGSLTSKHKRNLELNTWEAQRERLLGALKASSDQNGKLKLKIRISKKDLEELMAGKIQKQQQQKHKAEQGVSVQQMLLRLINATHDHQSHPRPWRPALQTIPELN